MFKGLVLSGLYFFIIFPALAQQRGAVNIITANGKKINLYDKAHGTLFTGSQTPVWEPLCP